MRGKWYGVCIGEGEGGGGMWNLKTSKASHLNARTSCIIS